MKLTKVFEGVKDLLSDNGDWGKGRIKGSFNIPYNLQWIIKLLFLLVFLVMLPFIFIYWCIEKLTDLFICALPFIGKFILWICWKVAAFFVWLGGLFKSFWAWLKSLFVRKTPQEKPKETKKSSKGWLWLLLLLLLLLLLCLGLFRMCGSNSENKEGSYIAVPTVMYDSAFDKVVVARAYLDGVQSAVTNDRVLVGLKYVNGAPLEPLKDVNFGDQAYNQAIVQIANDWKPIIVESLNPDLQLDEQQMVTITLAAMRMGPYGFPRSTFCHMVNEGKFDEATKWLCLQKADGSLRPMGPEARVYFYMLRQLWLKQISVADMLDMPMFSYKKLNDEDIAHEFLSGTAKQKLKTGNFPTPRKALKL